MAGDPSARRKRLNPVFRHVEVHAAFLRGQVDVDDAVAIARQQRLSCVHPVLHGVENGSEEGDNAIDGFPCRRHTLVGG
jgi:hypothetical protein